MVGECSKQNTLTMEDEIQLYTNWDDIKCPICLDSPHNAVLLQCSSNRNGCCSFVCDTDHLHSNCLNRFRQANNMPSKFVPLSIALYEAGPKLPSIAENLQSLDLPPGGKPACPLCRGEVSGWIVLDKVRAHLDERKRYCEEDKCRFSGTFIELRKHARIEHPYSCPSKIDPARQLDWENFQQSAEIIDVLSTIHSEIPRGVVLGDYVIEYGDDDDDDNLGDDEFDDFRGPEGNWWRSCILYQVFENFRASRNRRRSRVSDSRRVWTQRISYDASYSDEGSISSMEYGDYRGDDVVEADFVNSRRLSRGRARQRIEFTTVEWKGKRKLTDLGSVFGKWTVNNC
ncbi:hypothetical protein STAS_10597 [Striga asiatica]|uniref:Uncharacterized protein n=1 Tax=Striga asiatica TaxID=4170 RepID=A0A5A7PN89_STRAF|nr:hypothetical protein STAS_10597 [Striga asiatica]